MHISMYDGETNPEHWLEDYRLTMKAEGSNDDFTIQYLSLFLSCLTKAWLEQLELGSICCWGDLRSVFIGHFQGTYTWPRNSWDLHNYKQRPDETLWEYIQHFSKKRNELPNIIMPSSVARPVRRSSTCSAMRSHARRESS
jgi:hypothetical protein